MIIVAAMAFAALVPVPCTAGPESLGRLPSFRKPSEFQKVSPSVRAWLEAHGALIPQSVCSPEPNNVVRGHFEDARRWDLAVAATFPDSSGGLWVFFSEDTSRVERVCDGWRIGSEPLSDAGSVEGLAVASAKTIRSYWKFFGKPGGEPWPTHDGIEVITPETASTIHYRSHRAWVQYDGMD